MVNSDSTSILNRFMEENSPEQIEVLGKKISGKEVLEVLDSPSLLEPEHLWKLSPLLVGMPHSTFLEVLSMASPEQLKILQHEAANESIQHHLTVLVHDIAYGADMEEKQLEQIEQEISALDPKSTYFDELQGIGNKLERAEQWQSSAVDIISRALSLAWNTGRSDLVERLTDLKEHSIRTSNLYIGNPSGVDQEASTGLYSSLEKRLNEVYGNRNNPQDIEALQDDEPALEALAKLSIWYLKDYWEMGLLPEISNPRELELSAFTYSEHERQNHLQKLMEQTQANLSKLGLSTVKDLKKAHIYSKETLQQYIVNRK